MIWERHKSDVTEFENCLESDTAVLTDECDLGMVISKGVKDYFKISGLHGWINFGSAHCDRVYRKNFRFKQDNSKYEC